MANEVKLIFPFSSENPRPYELLCLTEQEAFVASYTSSTHCWEVALPIYSGSQKGRITFMSCWGNYTDIYTRIYTITVTGDDTFFWTDQSNSGTSFMGTSGILLSNGIYISFFAISGFVSGDFWTFTVGRTQLTVNESYERFASVVMYEGIYFISPSNKLRYCNGQTIWQIGVAGQPAMPTGRYIEEFFEHLVIGCPTVNGNQYPGWVMWSDLRDFTNFDVQKYNEASYYEFESETDLRETGFGCTGLKKLGNNLIVYTATRIYSISYVGLPLVMQKTVVVEGIGNVFPYAMCGYDNVHFFISDENFYALTGQGGPKAIGDDIKEFFFADVSTDPDLRYRLWSRIDRYYNEVHFIYCSTQSTGEFDKELVYNIKEGIWWSRQSDNAWCYTETTLSENANSIGSLDIEIGQLVGQIQNLGNQTSNIRVKLFGTSDRQVYREEVPGDTEQLPLVQPFLISQDMIYTDVKEVVTVDGMTIHADYDPATCAGIAVFCSNRVLIDEPIQWKPCGVWNKSVKYGLFSFPAKLTGRVFRWMFQPVPINAEKGVGFVRLTSWAESVEGLNEEIEK